MVSLRQWQYLVEVIEQGTFTDAAFELGVTQPGLSHQVKALERELGGLVLERLPGGLRLTPLGRAVLPHARAAIADARRAEQAAAAALGLRAATVEVTTITSLSLGVLPRLIHTWRADHAEVEVVLHEHRTMDDLLAAVRAGEGDLALAPTPEGWPGPITPLGEEELVVAVHPQHRLAGTDDPVPLAELAEEPWVQFSTTHGLAGVLDHLARLAGFSPRVAMRTDQTAAGPLYAAAGVGACLVPANILGSDYPGHVLALDPPIRREVAAFTRGTPDPIAQAFIDLAVHCAVLTRPARPQLG